MVRRMCFSGKHLRQVGDQSAGKWLSYPQVRFDRQIGLYIIKLLLAIVMKTMEQIMISRWRVATMQRNKYLMKIAIFILVSGVVAVFSGFLQYVSVHLPLPMVMFFMGIWTTSGFFVVLSD